MISVTCITIPFAQFEKEINSEQAKQCQILYLERMFNYLNILIHKTTFFTDVEH